MLLNLSYTNPEITRKVDLAVGKPFTLRERFKLGGIGSPKLHIAQTSVEINNLLLLDNNLNTCNIELRPKGIILRFRSLLETFGLIVPYYKLTIYKGDSETYSIYCDHHQVKILSSSNAIHKFFKRILDEKALQHPQFPPENP